MQEGEKGRGKGKKKGRKMLGGRRTEILGERRRERERRRETERRRERERRRESSSPPVEKRSLSQEMNFILLVLRFLV